jgi:hypothetical protein
MKGISGHYKSSWIAFNVLKKKGLIKDVTSKDYRGRHYPCFWLTERGIFIVLGEGAKSGTLLSRTLEIYPENEDLQFLIEAVPILGRNFFDVLYLAVLNKGPIKQTDATLYLLAQMMRELTREELRQFIIVLKKYPQTHQRWRDYAKQACKILTELSDML